MAEDLDVFLQAIGNPANFSLKLLVQLSKVLVSEDGADKQGKYRLKAEDKENAPSRPTGRSGRAVGQKKDKSNLDSGLRALKTIQQLTKITLPAVQTLLKEARIRSDTEGDKHNFPSDSMKYIIKCTQKAIETLEGHEHELGLKPLDMEKALANLISRFVEVNEHETAVDLILYLLQRLSAPKLLLKSAGTKKTKSKLALGVSSGTAFRQKAMKALVFSSKTDIKSVTKVSLVMALLTNSLRCWLDALNFVEEELEEALTQKNGLFKWCMHLVSLDCDTAGKHCDFLFKLLYKSSLSCRADPKAQLALQKMALKFYKNSSEFKKEHLHELIYKFGANFSRANGNDGGHLLILLQFYRSIAEYFGLPGQLASRSSSYIAWTQHFANLAEKLQSKKDDDIVSQMTRLSLNSASVSQEERTFEDSMDEIISTLQSLGSQRDRTSSIQTLKRVTELTQRIIARGSQDDVVWLPAMSKHLCRSLEVLTSFKLTGEFDVCKAALIMIEELASFVQRILQGTKAPAKDRFMKALVSFLVQHTGQLVSKASAHLESKCDIVLKSISICGTLCNLTDFNEGVKSLSAVCFNIAGVWYGRSQMEASLRLADFSIRLLQDYVTSTQLLDKDLNSLLSKRHDLLGLVYLSQEQVDKALEHFHTAMSLMSTEDWTRLADHNQHPFLTKAVPRYINTMFKYQKDNYAFISDTFCSELPQPQRTRIMELELRCLKLAHVQSDTSFWQITLNDNLLLLTPRSPEFALNRARLLLAKGHCLRGLLQFKEASDCFSEASFEIGQECLLICHTDKDSRNVDLESSIVQLEAEFFCYVCTAESGKDPVEQIRITLNTAERSTELAKSEKSKTPHNLIPQLLNLLDSMEKHMALLHQPSHRVRLFRMMISLLRVHPKLAKIDYNLSEILSNVGFEYTWMGYTGQAAFALEQAKALIESGFSNSSDSSNWRPSYALHLISIGLVEKSQTYISECETRSIDDYQSMTRSLGNISMLQVRALYFAEVGLISDAVRYAEDAYKTLKKATHLRLKGKKEQEIDNNLQLRVQNEEWILTMFMLRQFMLMGDLYKQQGSALESHYFYNQGLELSQSCHSLNFSFAFKVSLSELDLSRARTDESKRWLDDAMDMMNQDAVGFAPRDAVSLYVAQGDQKFQQLLLDASLAEYEMAENSLKEFTEESYIDQLDVIEKRIEVRKSASQLVPSSLKAKPKNSKCGPSKSQNTSSTKYRCLALDGVKCRVMIRKGRIHRDARRYAEAREALVVAQELRAVRRLEQMELCGAMANLRLQEIRNFLTGNQSFELFEEAVTVLPWCCPKAVITRSTKGAKAKTSNLLRNLDACENLFKKYQELASLHGTSENIHEANHGRWNVRLLAYHFAANTIPDTPDALTSWAYQSELSKGIACNRALQTLNRLRLQDSFHIDPIQSDTPDTIEQFMRNIPKSWTICSLSINLQLQELIVFRQSVQTEAIVCRIPLKRQFSREGEANALEYNEVMGRWSAILNDNNDATNAGKECESPKDKGAWWKTRKEIDERLKTLLVNIEQTWLGCFKGLLSFSSESYPKSTVDSFKASLTELVSQCVSKSCLGKMNTTISMDETAYLMFLELNETNAEDVEIEDALYFVLEHYQRQGIAIDYDEMNMDSLVSEYRELLKKAQTTKLDRGTSHTILILDKYLQAIPWESIPTLRSQSVSRVPSLSMLKNMVNVQASRGPVDPSSVYYVLNPGQDLKGTEAEFERSFKSYLSWKGVIGKAPTESEMSNAIGSKDVVMYFGHGGGEQYIRGHKISNLQSHATVLLMGCSSGKLHDGGDFDPWGTVLHYLIAGCPCIVANLWDVTDKDLDRFSMTLLRRWGLLGQESRLSLAEAVVDSRDSCILKYLVGAAPVVYGIPTYILGTN